MAGRGRSTGFTMGAEHRTKIGNSKILKHLIEHVCGKREMTASQVTAGLGLLKKVMPDLQSVTLEADPDSPIATAVSNQELVFAIANMLAKTGTAPNVSEEPQEPQHLN